MGIYDYDKDAKPKMSQEERDAMMKKFLDRVVRYKNYNLVQLQYWVH